MPRILMERSGEMEVFVLVVQKGGFSAAARSLDLTPSAVSKLVARLETRLGVRLFTRTTRALTLTDEGEAYHQAALRILQEMDAAEQGAAGTGVRGRLRVSATIPFGSMYIAPALPAFMARNPAITVELSLTDGVIDLVSEKTDVAIRMGDMPDSGLVARKLGQSRRVVCAAPAYLERFGRPASPVDLVAHECLTFNFRRDRPSWPFVRDGVSLDQSVTGRLVVNNGETMKQMTLEGAGIARLGYFHVAREIADGRLALLLEDWNPNDLEMVRAVYVSGGLLPQRVRAFIDYLAEVIEAHPNLR